LAAEQTQRGVQQLQSELDLSNKTSNEHRRAIAASVSLLAEGLAELKDTTGAQLRAVTETVEKLPQSQQTAQDSYRQLLTDANRSHQAHVQAAVDEVKKLIREGQGRYEAVYAQTLDRLAQLAQEDQQHYSKLYEETLERIEKLTAGNEKRYATARMETDATLAQIREGGRLQNATIRQLSDDVKGLRQEVSGAMRLAHDVQSLTAVCQKMSGNLLGWTAQERREVRDQLAQLVKSSESLLSAIGNRQRQLGEGSTPTTNEAAGEDATAVTQQGTGSP
jgi:hypothetical protein